VISGLDMQGRILQPVRRHKAKQFAAVAVEPLLERKLHFQDAVGAEEWIPSFTAMSTTQKRFGGLGTAPVVATRTLFFDEVPLSKYYMVVEGQPEVLFDPNEPPAIVATQGTVEEWTVQNRTPETHAFHIHQIHFPGGIPG
jgi:Multicopper oxidase